MSITPSRPRLLVAEAVLGFGLALFMLALGLLFSPLALSALFWKPIDSLLILIPVVGGAIGVWGFWLLARAVIWGREPGGLARHGRVSLVVGVCAALFAAVVVPDIMLGWRIAILLPVAVAIHFALIGWRFFSVREQTVGADRREGAAPAER
jgi:hypothetical protein